MLARICEGRASPFVFSCCDSMGVDVGTCTLDVGCLEEQDWTRPLQQVGLFGGLDLSFRPCRRGAGGLGKIVARFAARFPLHFLRSHLSGCEERGSIGDDDCCLFPLPFRGQRIWSWPPGFPRLDSLDSQGNPNIQDLELEKGKVRTGRTSSQTAAITRDLPPVNQSFPAVNPHLTVPGRAPPLPKSRQCRASGFFGVGGGEQVSRLQPLPSSSTLGSRVVVFAPDNPWPPDRRLAFSRFVPPLLRLPPDPSVPLEPSEMAGETVGKGGCCRLLTMKGHTRPTSSSATVP